METTKQSPQRFNPMFTLLITGPAPINVMNKRKDNKVNWRGQIRWMLLIQFQKLKLMN